MLPIKFFHSTNMCKVDFCYKCMFTLCRQGFDYPVIFKNICENYLEDGEFLELSTHFMEKDFDIFSMLLFMEEENFIVSTEIDIDTIIIKPLGISCDEEGFYFFCISPDVHQ